MSRAQFQHARSDCKHGAGLATIRYFNIPASNAESAHGRQMFSIAFSRATVEQKRNVNIMTQFCMPRIVQCFPPMAKSLRSSAIVKASGQNGFRTFCGFLWQMNFGLRGSSAERSTKVPPRFHQGSIQVSLCHCFRFGLPQGSSWAAKRFCCRSHQTFTKVENCVISLVFWGGSLSFLTGFCGMFSP